MNFHQQKQIEVINKIEEQVKKNSLGFSTVSPVKDYDSDYRLCLTSVHIPHQSLINELQQTFISPLQKISPEHYYYEPSSIHTAELRELK